MVNLTSIRRLIDCGNYPHLIDETDYKNIENLITYRQDVFNDKRLLDGIIFVRECKKKLTSCKKYGVMMSQPTGVGQWQSVSKKIYENKFLNYILNVKNITFDENGELEEEVLFFESVPMFNESVEMIHQFVSELLETSSIPNFKEFLSNIDGLCDDEELNHDYFLRQIYFNHKSKSAKLVLYKTSNNTNNLKYLVEQIADDKKSKFWINSNGITDCCSGCFTNPDIIAGLSIEVNSDGITKNLGYIAQPAQNQKFLQNSFSSVQQESEDYLISEFSRWEWISPEHAFELNQWKSDSRFANLVLAFHIETNSEGPTSKIIYGNNG